MKILKNLKFNGASLSIIIVNYKSEQYLGKCLASVYEKSTSEYEVIVVNNDIETDLDAIAKKYSQTKIYNYGKNSGFGTACNFGAKKAKGELLLFLNPDAQLLDDYVEYIIHKFNKSKANIGIIGPRLITEKGETQAWCAGKDLTIGQRIKNKFGIVESRKIWESQKDIYTDWVSGTALTIKSAVFEKIGGFDEKIFMYGEDLDLCARAKDLEYEILYSPERSVLHCGGRSRESLLRQKMQFFKSSIYYIKKRIKHKSRN